MRKREQLLISIEKRHAVNILSGAKRVELRRRTMHVAEGDVVWLYEKMPTGAIVGFAMVNGRNCASPRAIWAQFGTVSGLTKAEFMSYFAGSDTAFALSLHRPTVLGKPVPLVDLRKVHPGFQPPQFYCRLPADSPLHTLLSDQYKAPRRAK